VIELACNTFRLIYFLWDPFLSEQRWDYMVGRIFWTIHIPFGLATTFLIAFVWANSLKGVDMKQGFSPRLRVPFLVVSVILLGFDLVVSIMDGLYFPETSITVVLGAFMVLVQLCLASVFFVMGCRILHTFRRVLHSIHGRSREIRLVMVNKMTKRLIVSAVGMLLFVCGFAMVTVYFQTGPQPLFLIIVVAVLGVQITSIAQILAIPLPRREVSPIAVTPKVTTESLTSQSH